MADNQSKQADIGMVGLGVMGRNLLLNMAEHGFSVAGYDTDINKVNELLKEKSTYPYIRAASDIKDFILMLKRPRAVMLLVPAGSPVDSVINDLTGLLEPEDLIIDAGNSFFKDTDIRSRRLAEKKIRFMGVGISGGEEGARHGPSIMPGGPRDSYERIRPIFEAAAAKVNGDPCVAWLGPGSAGHFVKMVHNGIEYGFMQLIAESYDLMKRCLGLDDDKLHTVFSEWNNGVLNSFLIEIAAEIFSRIDEKTGKRLIDVILDVARQKGTGMWTSQSAMELQVPAPSIDMAVDLRNLSAFEEEREIAGRLLYRPPRRFKGDTDTFLKQLERALYTGMILTYSQGISVLAAASRTYRYDLDLETVARIWRGGCIIRAGLLQDILTAFRLNPELSGLLLDPGISQKIMDNQDNLRYIVCQAADAGIPAPALMASLGYLDASRSGWLPANLIQAQRDFFGAHTYERIDEIGTFHTEWLKKQK
jgi:6-phosphogluconate dehydrogenase